MTAPRLHTIDHTVQLTREWVRELSDRLNWADEPRAYKLLRVTLQALRDWLDVNEAAHLAAQLPLLIRGLFYEGWHPAGTPVSENSKEAFLARVTDAFKTDPLQQPDDAVSTVFKLLNHRISEGEIRDVRMQLPKRLRALWPEQ